MTGALQDLTALITAETAQNVPASVQTLVDAIRVRGKVAAVLFYGSGLWQQPTADTTYDFYVLVDRFRDLDNQPVAATLGWLLPPNVYYLETAEPALRCKYAVIRLDQFAAAARGRSLTPQIWARFAQPCCIAYARDEATRARLIDSLVQAVLTFHRAAIPLAPADATPRQLWLAGLAQTYGAELRSERPERTAILFDANAGAYQRRTDLARALLPDVKPGQRSAARRARLKRPLQKTIGLLRLMKANLTFNGGVDYLLYKVRRQSGVTVTATDFQRRHPLLSIWPLVWRVWRRGGFH